MFPIQLRQLAGEQEPLRVLLLEDDEHLRATLALVLQRQGFAVEAVAGSAEAIRLGQENVFDLIITDIRMEGLDGLQALEAMQSTQPGVQSLVVTGFSSEDDSLRALRLGVREFLRKPFEITAFREATKKLAEAVTKERQRQAKVDALNEVLLWALHGRAAEAGLEVAAASADLVFRLARTLNFPGSAARSLQLASLCGLLETRSPAGLPFALAESLPPSVHELLQQGPESLPSRICASALRRCESSLDDVDEEMARAMARLESQAGAPDSGAQSMLAVASTLEASGDVTAAEAAYLNLVEQSENAQAAPAFLGLARLAARRREMPLCEERALQAIQIARAWGPLTFSSVSVEAGMLLSLASSPQASSILRNTLELMQKLGFQQKAWQARLALCLVTQEGAWEEALEQLKSLCSPAQLLEYTHHLLPLLLRHCASNRDERAEQWLHSLLSEGGLSSLAWTGLSQAEQGVLERNRPEITATPIVLRARTLGDLQFFFGDESVPQSVTKKNSKAGLLLVYLMSMRGRWVNEDSLAEEFWPEDNLRGKANLTAVCSILRRHWKPGHWQGPDWEFVERGPLGIRLHPELRSWCDLCALEDELQQAGGSCADALLHYRYAFELQRGPFLDSCYMNWAELARERIRDRSREAFTAYARLANQRQLHSEALEVSRRLLEWDRCDGEAVQQAMEALMALQRAPEAIRTYEKYAQGLQRDFAMEPPISLFEMYHRARLL